jgi:uncharacterized protein Yka (UPF0111/DUF47 family)
MNPARGRHAFLRRLWGQIVPTMPDFHGQLRRQCEKLQASVEALGQYLQQHADDQLADEVRRQVQAGHDLRDETLAILYRSFITPIDREDIYTLSVSIDHILDYVKNTVREVETLRVEPDALMRNMAAQLGEGAQQLAQGLQLLSDKRATEITHEVNTRRIERYVEKLYREALAEMFGGEAYQRLVARGQEASVHDCLQFVVSRMKRREVYRHLSNAADRLAHAGEALRNIGIKYE